MSSKIETVILQNLVNDEKYMRKVIPFIKRDYFTDNTEQKIYDQIKLFIDEYNALPNKDDSNLAMQACCQAVLRVSPR